MTRLQRTIPPRTTRLQSILLAGTLLPLLALGASTSIRAQAPEQPPGEHHPPRAHEGEPRGGGAREPGTPRAERRQNDGARQQAQQPEGPRGGARAERNADGEAPQHGRKARAAGTEPGTPAAQSPATPPAARADDSARPGRKHRDAANPTATTPSANPDRAAPTRPDDEDRATRRDRRAAERANEKGAAPNAADRGDRRERTGDPDRRSSDRDDAQRDDRRDNGNRRDGKRNDADNVRPDAVRPADRAPGDDRRPGDRPRADDARRDETGTGRGLAGGFLPPAAGARRLDDIRAQRRETRDGDRVVIREPGRTIVQEGGRAFITHDETDRFRALGLDVRRERRGADFVDTARRPNGDLILTFTDPQGRLLRRVRRGPDGREVVLIDNGYGGVVRPLAEDVVVLPPPPIRIPRDRYIVDYRDADAGLVYDTLVAPPLAPPPRRYTLDQIRYSPDIRNYVRQVDINTINFDTGSWTIPEAASGKLEALATALKRAIGRNPNSVFLVEGFTDAVGNAEDNLSLSDRRAQSVAEVLTRDFNVPPENLTTQGYGEQDLKENTQGPSAANRRVVVQNITPLLAAGGDQPEAH